MDWIQAILDSIQRQARKHGNELSGSSKSGEFDSLSDYVLTDVFKYLNGCLSNSVH